MSFVGQCSLYSVKTVSKALVFVGPLDACRGVRAWPVWSPRDLNRIPMRSPRETRTLDMKEGGFPPSKIYTQSQPTEPPSPNNSPAPCLRSAFCVPLLPLRCKRPTSEKACVLEGLRDFFLSLQCHPSTTFFLMCTCMYCPSSTGRRRRVSCKDVSEIGRSIDNNRMGAAVESTIASCESIQGEIRGLQNMAHRQVAT